MFSGWTGGKSTQLGDRNVSLTQDNHLASLELREVLGEMRFCFMNIEVNHGLSLNQVQGSVKRANGRSAKALLAADF